jgi:hypothetical protein
MNSVHRQCINIPMDTINTMIALTDTNTTTTMSIILE